MQPKYSELDVKLQARLENVTIFQQLTGFNSIPNQYWTLCNFQPPTEGSEIVQLSNMGFLKKSQFIGVDSDKDNEGIIEQNEAWHKGSGATWIRADWLTAIHTHKPFNPSMIYLDTIMFLDNIRLAKLVRSTMLRCPFNTVLIVNAIIANVRDYRTADEERFMKTLTSYMGIEFNKWSKEVTRFEYNATGKTNMQSLIFHKTIK